MRTRTTGLVLAGIFLAAYAIFLLRHNSFSVGGSDSSGYLNAAKRMAAGRLVERPRTLDRLGLPDQEVQLVTPLGFVTGPRGTMAPYYPAGFPAHMAAAAQLFGWNLGPFLVSPLAAALCLPLFCLVARELALSPIWAAAGTALFAAWPILIGQAIQPMSDATATFWSLASVLCAVKARRRAVGSSGAALGIAVLVLPTNFPLAAPLAFALPNSAVIPWSAATKNLPAIGTTRADPSATLGGTAGSTSPSRSSSSLLCRHPSRQS